MEENKEEKFFWWRGIEEKNTKKIHDRTSLIFEKKPAHSVYERKAAHSPKDNIKKTSIQIFLQKNWHFSKNISFSEEKRKRLQFYIAIIRQFYPALFRQL